MSSLDDPSRSLLDEVCSTALPNPDIPVGLSTAAAYPERTAAAFEIAAALGYDGVEVMVWADPVSQNVAELARLSERFDIPILSVHAPCLIFTQRVWSPDPMTRLDMAAQTASKLGAPTVVVHPPFRWQRDYARGFAEQIARISHDTGVTLAVENMYPLKTKNRNWHPYHPHWDPTEVGFSDYTLDLSHAATAHTNSLDLAERMGGNLSHIHLGDGTGSFKDEHLIPGRGTQPCAEVLQMLARNGFKGSVVAEISTRHIKLRHGRELREAELAETLAFARQHLATPVPAPAPPAPAVSAAVV